MYSIGAIILIDNVVLNSGNCMPNKATMLTYVTHVTQVARRPWNNYVLSGAPGLGAAGCEAEAKPHSWRSSGRSMQRNVLNINEKIDEMAVK